MPAPVRPLGPCWHDGPVTDGTSAAGTDPPFGTYVDVAVRRTGLVGTALLTSLALGSALLGLLGEVDGIDAALATVIGGLGAVGVWAGAVRPRLLVSDAGVCVVNPLRSYGIPWSEVAAFECDHGLAVRRRDGSRVDVSAQPANGLRRIVKGTPGRADRLAIALNAYLAGSAPPGTEPARVSVETTEGRRDLRVLGVLATLGVGLSALLRHLLG